MQGFKQVEVQEKSGDWLSFYGLLLRLQIFFFLFYFIVAAERDAGKLGEGEGDDI